MSCWLHCEDGSYLQKRNITRLFLVTDVLKDEASIRVSVVGTVTPYTFANYPSKDQAQQRLNKLITALTTN